LEITPLEHTEFCQLIVPVHLHYISTFSDKLFKGYVLEGYAPGAPPNFVS